MITSCLSPLLEEMTTPAKSPSCDLLTVSPTKQRSDPAAPSKLRWLLAVFPKASPVLETGVKMRRTTPPPHPAPKVTVTATIEINEELLRRSGVFLKGFVV